jgi:hypothetical protein
MISYFILLFLFSEFYSQITLPIHIKKLPKITPFNRTSFYPDNSLRSLIEVPTESEHGFRTFVNLCLGTPSQCFDLTISTNSFYLWVSDAKSSIQESKNKYDYSLSQTVVRNMNQISYKFYNQKITGYEASDILTFKKQDLSRINFLIISTTDRMAHMDGMIGL